MDTANRKWVLNISLSFNHKKRPDIHTPAMCEKVGSFYISVLFPCDIIGPLVKDETVVAFILALPRKLVRGLVNRAALFVWWTGAWANEGDNVLTVYIFACALQIQSQLLFM